MFQSVQDLITAIDTNTDIPAAVNEVNTAFNYVTAQRVFYGNGLHQTQSQQTYLSSQTLGLSQQQDSISAANIPLIASELTKDQIATTATLDSIGRAPATSLFDYLK